MIGTFTGKGDAHASGAVKKALPFSLINRGKWPIILFSKSHGGGRLKTSHIIILKHSHRLDRRGGGGPMVLRSSHCEKCHFKPTPPPLPYEMEMEETAGGLKMMVGRITNLGFSQAWQGGEGKPYDSHSSRNLTGQVG